MTPLLPSFLDSIGSVTLPLAEFGPFGLGNLVIPLAGMGLALTAIIFGSIDKMQKRRLRHELMRVALEKGQPLPPELLDERPATARNDDRKGGLICVAVGVALFIFLSALRVHNGLPWVGLIPTFVGGALLLNWWLERGGPADPHQR